MIDIQHIKEEPSLLLPENTLANAKSSTENRKHNSENQANTWSTYQCWCISVTELDVREDQCGLAPILSPLGCTNYLSSDKVLKGKETDYGSQ